MVQGSTQSKGGRSVPTTLSLDKRCQEFAEEARDVGSVVAIFYYGEEPTPTIFTMVDKASYADARAIGAIQTKFISRYGRGKVYFQILGANVLLPTGSRALYERGSDRT